MERDHRMIFIHKVVYRRLNLSTPIVQILEYNSKEEKFLLIEVLDTT